METVSCILSDLNDGNLNRETDAELEQFLNQKKIRFVNLEGWKKINSREIESGNLIGKPREKITSIENMLSLVS